MSAYQDIQDRRLVQKQAQAAAIAERIERYKAELASTPAELTDDQYTLIEELQKTRRYLAELRKDNRSIDDQRSVLNKLQELEREYPTVQPVLDAQARHRNIRQALEGALREYLTVAGAAYQEQP